MGSGDLILRRHRPGDIGWAVHRHGVLYERFGFVLVEENAHRSFGHDLVGQTWNLDLDREGAR